VNNSPVLPAIAGLTIGVVFIALFAHAFQSLAPITEILHNPQLQIPPPRPEIKMIYNDTEYVAQAVTFSWGRDMLYIGNVSDTLSSQNTTAKMQQGGLLGFLVDIYNDTASPMPIKAVYVYDYPTNDFEGILERLDKDEKSINNNSTSDGNDNVYLVDLEKGNYYLRANYQTDSGSASYYFRVSVDIP
jgi:hypothetical protein